MLKRFVIIIIALFVGFLYFPHPSEASSKQQLIIINKKTNKLAFFQNGKLIKTYPVATGKTRRLTPEGTFYVREKIKNRPYYKLHIKGGDPRNPLGDRWMGISYNEHGTFPIGIHGNNNERSIGKYISHGCIRLHNKDAHELYRKVQVRTKVVITTSKKSFTALASKYIKKTVAKK